MVVANLGWGAELSPSVIVEENTVVPKLQASLTAVDKVVPCYCSHRLLQPLPPSLTGTFGDNEEENMKVSTLTSFFGKRDSCRHPGPRLTKGRSGNYFNNILEDLGGID